MNAVVIAIEYAAAAIFIIPLLLVAVSDGRKESSPTVRREPPFVRVLRPGRRPPRLEAYHVAAIAPATSEQRGANVMGYSDMPFSITSKFSVPGGAEHLVTLRATNAQDFKIRLQEADAIFPTAGFLTWLEGPPAIVPYADEVSPDPDVEQPVTPDVETTVARLKAKAAAQAAHAQAQKTVAHVKANGGNGQTHEPPVLPNGQTPFEPRCPDHARASKSGFGPTGSLYCPTLLEDGSYCKWRWTPPAPVRKAVPANVN